MKPYWPYIGGALMGFAIGLTLIATVGTINAVDPGRDPQPQVHQVVLRDGRTVECVSLRSAITCDFTK